MNYFLAALKKYAVFSGRARRKEYWYFALFYLIFAFLIGVICGIVGSMALIYVYYLAIIIPFLAVGVRRMHDTGHSGWYLLIPIYSLILACTDGDRGTNEYGPDPKEREIYGADDYQKPFDINSQA